MRGVLLFILFYVIFKSLGHLKMAERLAARLTAQEEQIRRLTREISKLRDGLSGDLDVVGVSPLLETLRTDNEKLRYRLVHLRRGLQAERGLRADTPQDAKKPAASQKVASKSGRETTGGGNKVGAEP